MSTLTTSLNCPKTIPVPFTITVNTSGTTPDSVDGHPSATTHAGFTRISEFTLTPIITASGSDPAIEELFPGGLSNRIAKWDFGDGYTLSGANVFVYANYGITFPHGILAHSVLFGLGTIGAIMVMKAIFDLVLNDRIELWLLDRKIQAFWERKARDEQQRNKMRDSAKQYNTSFYTPPPQEEVNEVGNEFLAALQ